MRRLTRVNLGLAGLPLALAVLALLAFTWGTQP